MHFGERLHGPDVFSELLFLLRRQNHFLVFKTRRNSHREIADINIQRRPAGCYQILLADFHRAISQALGNFANQLFLVTESP